MTMDGKVRDLFETLGLDTNEKREKLKRIERLTLQGKKSQKFKYKAVGDLQGKIEDNQYA